MYSQIYVHVKHVHVIYVHVFTKFMWHGDHDVSLMAGIVLSDSDHYAYYECSLSKCGWVTKTYPNITSID
jgi:hypothetical protein